jgi:hypothetical protein
MHAVGLRTSAKKEAASSANNMRKETMIIMTFTTTSPTDNVPQLEDAMKWGGGGEGFLS